MAETGALLTPQKLPDSRQPLSRAATILFVLPLPQAGVAGLAHTRALGEPSLFGAPGNLVHARALGSPSIPFALVLLHVNERISRDWPAVTSSFALYYLEAEEVAAPGLAHDRQHGFHGLLSGVAPASLVHARSLGQTTALWPGNTVLQPGAVVHARTLGLPGITGGGSGLSALSLVHDRALGPIVLIATLPVIPPQKTYWQRTLRGVRRRAFWD